MEKIKTIGKAIIASPAVKLAFKGLIVAVATAAAGALGVAIAPETVGSFISFLG